MISIGPTSVSRPQQCRLLPPQRSSTKTRGFEASLAGYITDAWQITGGYAYTDARITGATSATIVPGNRVGLVPYNTFSLWNKYQFNPVWAAGVGVIRYTNFFASSDDTVLLPEFTRVDAAIYFRLNETWRAQLNIENHFRSKYYCDRRRQQQHHARITASIPPVGHRQILMRLKVRRGAEHHTKSRRVA